VGIVTGSVSGNLTAVDFDCPDTYQAVLERARNVGLGDIVERVARGYCDSTPGGGKRWLLRCPSEAPQGMGRNVALARRPKLADEKEHLKDNVKILIETREYVILAPTNGKVHPTGKPYVRLSGGFDTIACVTGEEHDDLLELLRSFDEMPRTEACTQSAVRDTEAGDRPGDDFTRRTTWQELLKPRGWKLVYTKDGVTNWRRPGKEVGTSATTNYGNSDLFYPFTSSTEFEPNKSYNRFAAYAVFEHGGNFTAAASALAAQGYGRSSGPGDRAKGGNTNGASGTKPDAKPDRSGESVVNAQPRSLAELVAIFDRWLCLSDHMPLYAMLGTIAANRLPGDPVWLGIIAPPSSAKTEFLNSTSQLPFVVDLATLTPAGLLSGTPRKQRGPGATGGVLRQVERLNDTGILCLKDFGSILNMRPDAKAEILAALREIYDGRWSRTLGTDGGRTLEWKGKLGLIFGATPIIDSHHGVMGQMGERFNFVRLPEAGPKQLAMALKHSGKRTSAMRQELSEAAAGLFARPLPEPRPLTEDEQQRLIDMAWLTVRMRSAVERDRHTRELENILGVEGPAQFGLTLERLIAGLDTLGMDREQAFQVAERVAKDSVNPLRRRAFEFLQEKRQQHDIQAARRVPTKVVAEAMGLPTNTVRRVLEDLAAYRLVTRHPQGQGKSDLWEAAE
jgi:hypothetical protein